MQTKNYSAVAVFMLKKKSGSFEIIATPLKMVGPLA